MTIHHGTTSAVARGRLRAATSAAITTILINAEATADRYGWDLQPVLFGLFDHLSTDGIVAVEIDPTISEPHLWTIPDPRHGVPTPVAVILHRLATDLTGPAARRWLDAWLHANGRTCVGTGLAFEAWAGRSDPATGTATWPKPRPATDTRSAS